jgi:dienelactone hydrolase
MDVPQQGQEFTVTILAGQVPLTGDLVIPKEAIGLILFAHGSGSSRISPRNRYVAHILQQAGLATLLMDLLTPLEAAEDLRTTQFRFDIPLLAERLTKVVDWCQQFPGIKEPLPLGLFGASTGAAAALVTAANRSNKVKGVVSRGGRPDLASSSLSQVQAPTLLIVGGQDHTVLEINQIALAQIQSEKRLSIIPGATHLFEERGALEEVARLASQWFRHYLAPATKRPIYA